MKMSPFRTFARPLTRLARKMVPTRFIRDDRAAVTVIFALTAIVLLGFATFAIDTARAQILRSRLSFAVDAAALSVGKVLDTQDEAGLSALADGIVRANVPSNMLNPAGILGADDLVTEVRDGANADRKKVSATATMQSTLLGFLGESTTVQVDANATVTREIRGIELALVLDTTGSMGDPSGSRGRTKLQALKDSAKDLLDTIYGEEESLPDLRVSVVPFASYVNVMSHPEWTIPGALTVPTIPALDVWLGGRPNFEAGTDPWCVDDRATSIFAEDDTPPTSLLAKFPAAISYTRRLISIFPFRFGWSVSTPSCPTIEALPLTAERSVVEAKINSLEADGNTRADRGLAWGWRSVSERWQNLWGTPGWPADNDDPSIEKVIVIMSDGENYPPGIELLADQRLARECEAIKADGIRIISINFQTPTDLYPLYRNCASSPDLFFPAVTADQLADTFRTIGATLTVLRLIE